MKTTINSLTEILPVSVSTVTSYTGTFDMWFNIVPNTIDWVSHQKAKRLHNKYALWLSKTEAQTTKVAPHCDAYNEKWQRK